MSKKWCWYCKHRGIRFRLFGNQGHVHCEHPDEAVVKGRDYKEGEHWSGWDSLRMCYDTCKHWEEEVAG